MIQFKYKVIIQFNGSRYHGWQIQDRKTLTIQGEFNRALKVIFKEDIKTLGSGRTDAGVHAIEFHVVFRPSFSLDLEALVKALNGNLPMDIRAISAQQIGENFRPTYDAISKEYRYYFTTDQNGLPFSKSMMTYLNYKLDLKLMNQACKVFIGKHDFKNFHCLGSEPSSTVREIFECEVLRVDKLKDFVLPAGFYLRIKGNGFLKQMVRLIMGALWDVGRGKLTPEQVGEALRSSEFKHIAAVAPPNGLYKYNVQYNK